MRWSQIIFLSSVFVSGVLHGVSALPINLSHIDPAGTQLLARTLKAGDLKEHTATVREKAFSHGSYYRKTKDGVNYLPIGKKMPKGTQADHILEAQTVVKALNNAGHTLDDKQKAAVIEALNHKDNLIHVSKSINGLKNHFTNAVLNDKPQKVHPQLAAYTEATKEKGLQTARAVDKALRDHGIDTVNVHDLHKGLLAHASDPENKDDGKKKKKKKT